MKSKVTKFDLAAAFKELDSLDFPKPVEREEKVITNTKLSESCTTKSSGKKAITDLLFEDLYSVNDSNDLEAAKNDRAESVAQAKLARIEKIVDLNAESEEDLLPSYVGKVIVQCPQCMTLFYKDQADIEKSADDENIVNVNEICQHCGNSSGYEIIGKVAEAKSEEQPVEEVPAEESQAEENGDLDLNFEEPTSEVDPEGTGEAEVTGQDDIPDEAGSEETSEVEDVELEPVEDSEAPAEEEKKEESFIRQSGNMLNESRPDLAEPVIAKKYEEGGKTEIFTELPDYEVEVEQKGNKVELEVEPKNESMNNSKMLKDFEKDDTDYHSEHLSINEEVDPWSDAAIDNLVVDQVQESINNSELLKDGELDTEHHSDNLTINEDMDSSTLIKKLDEYSAYIKLLNDEIKAEENAAKSAKNEFIKKMHEKNVEQLKAELDKAVPEEVKAEAAINELPTGEDAAKDLTKNESLNNSKMLKDFEKDGLLKSEHESDHLSINESAEDIDLSLTAANVDDMLDSKEFQTPVSDEEIQDIFADTISEDTKALEDISGVNEEALEECINKSLVKVYENVDKFKLTDCTVNDKGFIVEGNIIFKSGKVKHTSYRFNEALKADHKLKLTGLNESLAKDSKFILECQLDSADTWVIPSSFEYKYSIGRNLVEGIIKR